MTAAPSTVDSRPGEGEAPGPACPSTGRHGTAAAYNSHGCRCPDARWQASKDRARRAMAGYPGGLLDPTGTRRRIEALMAIGWPREAIAAAVGLGETTAIFRRNNHRRVLRATAQAVRAAYDRLSGTPGPSPITAGRALAAGMVPPIGWDDDTLDDPDAQPWMELHADGIRRPGRLQCARDDCRTWFVAHRGRMYCTPDCSYLAERERDRALRKAYYRDRDRAKRAAASTRRVAA